MCSVNKALARSDFQYDVAVIGGGPGGSAAAKRCAEDGLKTVLLEKSTPPRNKVCTGMIMSDMAQALIKEEFGEPPEEVLTTPSHLLGFRFRAPGVRVMTIERRMPFAWRRDFDFWLNRAARTAGVELRYPARVRGVVEQDERYILSFEQEGQPHTLMARFLIGADGTLSAVRKALFPPVAMRSNLNVRLCYPGALELEPEYVHYFYFPDLSGFDVNFKGDVFLLEVSPRPTQGDGADIVRQAEDWLAREYGFEPGTAPLWRDGCYEPAMSRKPFKEPFPLALNNALLVGNAAGLNIPITGEGIGTAIKSGLGAADAVISAHKKGKMAADFYAGFCREMISTLEGMYPPPGMLRDSVQKGMDSFLEAMKDIYADSLTVR